MGKGASVLVFMANRCLTEVTVKRPSTPLQSLVQCGRSCFMLGTQHRAEAGFYFLFLPSLRAKKEKRKQNEKRTKGKANLKRKTEIQNNVGQSFRVNLYHLENEKAYIIITTLGKIYLSVHSTLHVKPSISPETSTFLTGCPESRYDAIPDTFISVSWPQSFVECHTPCTQDTRQTTEFDDEPKSLITMEIVVHCWTPA